MQPATLRCLSIEYRRYAPRALREYVSDEQRRGINSMESRAVGPKHQRKLYVERPLVVPQRCAGGSHRRPTVGVLVKRATRRPGAAYVQVMA